MAEALRTTYWVPQTGSKFARSACGTKRSVRAAAPCASAGAAIFCDMANVPAPATAFSSVLRSMVGSSCVARPTPLTLATDGPVLALHLAEGDDYFRPTSLYP